MHGDGHETSLITKQSRENRNLDLDASSSSYGSSPVYRSCLSLSPASRSSPPSPATLSAGEAPGFRSILFLLASGHTGYKPLPPPPHKISLDLPNHRSIQTPRLQNITSNIMKLNLLTTLLTTTLLTSAPVFAGPVSYAACQAGCAGIVMACYAAAGFTWGATLGATAPASIIACNSAYAGCQSVCAGLTLGPWCP